jgi:hypothetical protein
MISLPWNNDHLIRIVRDLEKLIEVAHDTLKGITHEVERTIGVNDGVFFKGSEIFLANDTIVEDRLVIVGATRRCAREAAAAAGGCESSLSYRSSASKGLNCRSSQHGAEVTLLFCAKLCFSDVNGARVLKTLWYRMT